MKKRFAIFKNTKVIKGLLIALVVVLSAFSFFYIETTTNRVFIDNSLIYAPITNIAPVSPGVLNSVNVYEGENISKGTALAVVNGTTLYSKTSGIIVMVNKSIGSIVSSTNPVIEMINNNDFRVAGTIDENKGLNDIRVGQVASFTVDAFPGKVYYGLVDEIDPTAKTTQISYSISSERPTQQFIIYVKFNPAKYPELLNGMSAKLTIYTK